MTLAPRREGITRTTGPVSSGGWHLYWRTETPLPGGNEPRWHYSRWHHSAECPCWRSEHDAARVTALEAEVLREDHVHSYAYLRGDPAGFDAEWDLVDVDERTTDDRLLEALQAAHDAAKELATESRAAREVLADVEGALLSLGLSCDCDPDARSYRVRARQR